MKKNQALISIQPYFVMESDNFCQHILIENGISHFFSFSNNSSQDITLPLLVDSCSNLIFEYKDGKVVECSSKIKGNVLTSLFQNDNWYLLTGEKKTGTIRLYDAKLNELKDAVLANIK